MMDICAPCQPDNYRDAIWQKWIYIMGIQITTDGAGCLMVLKQFAGIRDDSCSLSK